LNTYKLTGFEDSEANWRVEGRVWSPDLLWERETLRRRERKKEREKERDGDYWDDGDAAFGCLWILAWPAQFWQALPLE
jgi:hypothetical protein